MKQVAVEDLVAAHQAGLWRYLRFLGCESARAEDLVQEVFLAVWRKPFEERSEAATAGYLRTVARNLFLMEVRRAKARPVVDRLDDADAAWEAHAGSDDGESYRAALAACLEELGGKARDAVTALYGDGRSRKEIAARLGLTVEGVKTLLRRAREALRGCIVRRMRS